MTCSVSLCQDKTPERVLSEGSGYRSFYFSLSKWSHHRDHPVSCIPPHLSPDSWTLRLSGAAASFAIRFLQYFSTSVLHRSGQCVVSCSQEGSGAFLMRLPSRHITVNSSELRSPLEHRLPHSLVPASDALASTILPSPTPSMRGMGTTRRQHHTATPP